MRVSLLWIYYSWVLLEDRSPVDPEVNGDNVICEVLYTRYVKVVWDMVLLEEATDNQF